MTAPAARWHRYAAALGVVVALALGAASLLRRPSSMMIVPTARLVDLRAGEAAHGPKGKVGRGTVGDEIRWVAPVRDDHIQSTFETEDVAIPAQASLDFALGASVKEGTDRAVTFEVRTCVEQVCEQLFSERVDFAAVGPDEWLERRVSLAPFAGTTRRFVFHALAAAPTTHVLWANPTVIASVPRTKSDRNVILISLDTLRADHVGSYGYARDTTPFLDATFAHGGARFEHCTAAATTTTASHMTIFTSLPPSVHGVGLVGLESLPAWLSTLPELLRNAGFTTGAITENGWVTFSLGFGRGFDTFRENKGPNIMEPKGQVDVMVGQANAWLRRHRDERFFLFLHTYQVHFPYAPPPEYAALFTDDVPGSVPASAADAANYDREIRFTDDTLRSLFATIHELGLDEHTVVVLTSDHGEEFSEHGCIWHGEQLYEEVTHVPLMLTGPGIPAGTRILEPVGLIDVMPTILELAGVPIPAQAMGTSLVPALARGGADPDRTLFTEAWSESVCPRAANQRPGVVVRAGTRKLARYQRRGAPAYELYDLASDPHERSDLAAADAAELAGLRAAVDGYRDQCRARADVLRAAAPSGSEPAAAAGLDARQREKLRALGYAQ